MAGLDDLFQSSWFQYGYPLGSALAAAASPALARGIYAANTGFGLANRIRQNQLEQQQQEAAAQPLRELFSGQKFVTPQIDPNQPLSLPPDQETAISNVAAPTNTQPTFSEPVRKLGEALIAARDVGGAARLAQGVLQRERQNPMTLSPNQEIWDPEQQRSIYRAAPAPVAPELPKPYDYGTAETGIYESPGGGIEGPHRQLIPPRVDPLADLKKQNLELEIRERGARIRRLDEAAKAAKDPKASEEKLNTMYQGLLRDRKESSEMGMDDRVENINTVLDDVLARLAQIAQQKRSQGGGGTGRREKYDIEGNPVR